MRLFFARLGVVPFEAAMGFLVLFAGLVGVFHLSTSTDILNDLLPEWLVTGLNISYALSGLGMLLGLGFGRRDLEGGGIVLLASAVAVRLVAVLVVVGVTGPTFVLLLFYAGFLAACYVRFMSLVKNEVVLKIRNHGDLDNVHEDIDQDQLQMRDGAGDDDD